jgi:hypothetical protein
MPDASNWKGCRPKFTSTRAPWLHTQRCVEPARVVEVGALQQRQRGGGGVFQRTDGGGPCGHGCVAVPPPCNSQAAGRRPTGATQRAGKRAEQHGWLHTHALTPLKHRHARSPFPHLCRPMVGYSGWPVTLRKAVPSICPFLLQGGGGGRGGGARAGDRGR